MKKTKKKVFKGAGWIIGLIVGAITGIIFAVATDVMGLIGAISASVSIPVGMMLENKFQGEKAAYPKSGKSLFVILFLTGLALFFVCLFNVI